MNDLQKTQLNLLKAFVKVCEKHNLKYFLVCGTCLGAARHQGFIPWDDDIDVGMPRADYDKFVKLQSEFEGTPYFIQTWRTDKHYCYNFAKLRDSSTTYIENYFYLHRINHGVWIDIFPIDGVSKKDNKPRKKYKPKFLYVWFEVYCSILPQLWRKLHKGTWFRDLWLNFLAAITWIFDIGHFHRRMTERHMRKIPYDEAVLVANFYGIRLKKEAMPKYLFDEVTKLKFEDIEVNVPKKYDEYLTYLYGDWRKFPPPEQQVGHHKDKGFSLTQGYESYIKEHKI